MMCGSHIIRVKRLRSESEGISSVLRPNLAAPRCQQNFTDTCLYLLELPRMLGLKTHTLHTMPHIGLVTPSS